MKKISSNTDTKGETQLGRSLGRSDIFNFHDLYYFKTRSPWLAPVTRIFLSVKSKATDIWKAIRVRIMVTGHGQIRDAGKLSRIE